MPTGSKGMTNQLSNIKTQGDHRGLIVDIDIEKLIGHHKSYPEISFRKLILSNPKVIQKYLEEVETNFEK